MNPPSAARSGTPGVAALGLGQLFRQERFDGPSEVFGNNWVTRDVASSCDHSGICSTLIARIIHEDHRVPSTSLL